MEETKTFEIDGINYCYRDIILAAHEHKSNKLQHLEKIETLKFLDDIGVNITESGEDKPLRRFIEGVILKTMWRTEDGGHNSYWNDAFYLTNRFNVEDYYKKKTAVVSLWNGRHKYWEWKTHYGYDNAKLLNNMGIIKKDEVDQYTTEEGGYSFLPQHIHDGIANHLKLNKSELAVAHLICKTVDEKQKSGNRYSGMYPKLERVSYATELP